MNPSDRQEVARIIKETLKKAVLATTRDSGAYLQNIDDSEVSIYGEFRAKLLYLFRAIETEPEEPVSSGCEAEPDPEEPKKKMCEYCNEPIAIRNPTGYCDHLYYPDNVNKSLKPEEPYKECTHEFLDPSKFCAYETCHKCGLQRMKQPDDTLTPLGKAQEQIEDYKEVIETLEGKLYDMTYNYGEAMQIKDKAEHLMREAQKELEKWKRGAVRLAQMVDNRMGECSIDVHAYIAGSACLPVDELFKEEE